MGRWARWQVNLFWVSLAGAGAGILGLAMVEVADGQWRHVAFLIPALVLIPICAFLYRQLSGSLASLNDKEAWLRLLAEEASDAIFVSDLATRRFVAANRMATALTGYTREELLSMRVRDLVAFGPGEEAERVRTLQAGEPFRGESEIIGKDGARVLVEVSAVAVGGAVQTIARPIGQRKAVEEALRHSEEVFRAVSELTSDYAYSMTVEEDGSLTPEWLTGAFERVTGYPVEEIGYGWQTLVHPDDVPEMTELLIDALRSGGTTDSEFRIVTKSGEIKHLRAISRWEKDEPEGRVVRVVGAVSDVTEHKLLQESLEKTEQRYQRLYERLPIAIYRRKYKGGTLSANPTCVEMFGYPDEKTYAEQGPLEFYVDPRDRDPWIGALEKEGVVRNYEVLYKRYDGSTFWGRNTARMVTEADGTEVIEGAIVDITEEKELNEELKATLRDLRRADLEKKRLLTHLVRAKEEERNRVASDIHDDSVQLMTAVAIDLERVSRRLSDDELRASLERLEGRVRDAVQRLRKMVFELRPPALDEEGVAAALGLYLEEFSIDTGIDYELVNNLDAEPVNPTRVVLFRIAQEALTNVRKHSNASRVVVTLGRRDEGVAMTMFDDGNGFDVTSIEVNNPGHIGVAEMRERAEMGGGTFHLESEPGRGTEVAVWLPEFSR